MSYEQVILPNGQLRKKKKKKREPVAVGKLGIVRLKGKALEDLRRACFERDLYECMECRRGVWWDWTQERYGIPRGEMAHIRTKRNNGDTLANVRTLCPDCHLKEHSYGKAMQKPCPKRERPA